ncbi:hypothetical protein [Actinomadura nitritigenes]|uniref:hypothetical protein n=1 Tax=Actinomadura nitritigenes TaxID=134602 RepID=UPI003D8D0307
MFFVVTASAPVTVAADRLPTSFAVTGVVGIPLLYVLLAVFTSGYAAMAAPSATPAPSTPTSPTGSDASPSSARPHRIHLLQRHADRPARAVRLHASYLLNSETGLRLPWWKVVLLGVAVLGMLLAVEFLTVLLFDLDADHGATRAAFRFAMAGFMGFEAAAPLQRGMPRPATGRQPCHLHRRNRIGVFYTSWSGR